MRDAGAMIERALDMEARGNARVTMSRGRMSVRFGIDHETSVLRNYADSDKWIVVRRVYESDGWENSAEAKARGWGYVRYGCYGYNRVNSRLRLEHYIAASCRGVWNPGGDSYVEALPWREDGNYPDPRPVREVLYELRRLT